MVIEHSLKHIDYLLAHDYKNSIGEDWYEELKDTVNSEYMSNLIFLIDQVNQSSEDVFPRLQKDIFKAYKETSYHDVKVVIFGDEPDNLMSNGLSFGEYGSTDILKGLNLRLLRQSSFKENELDFFDKSLVNWTQQGVMMLNTSLIASKITKHKYEVYFRELTRQTIKSLNDKVDIIFCFTNKQQSDIFEKYVNQDYNHVLKYETLIDSPMFTDINDILIYSKQKAIDW